MFSNALNTLFFIFTMLISSVAFTQNLTIAGQVLDAEDSAPIIGARIEVLNTAYKAVSGLDGSFLFRNIPSQDYTVKITFVGYEPYLLEVNSRALQNKYVVKLITKATETGEVEIFAVREVDSEASARASEKESFTVINVISAAEIEVSPDITVANVVQRVSGVSIERNNNGDGQHAIVRGMDKRYNYTLVNGVKIPSPDPRNRYVPLDVFPADLLDRLEVTKALTPNMEGDAIGGVMDMKMKNAPNYFNITFNAGTGYNQMFFNTPYRSFDRSTTSRFSPRYLNGNDYAASTADFPLENINFQEGMPNPNQVYSLSIGNRFLNNKLGVLVAGSYQNTYRGAESIFMQVFVNQEDNTPYYERVQVRQFSTQQVRSGVHTKLDYRFNNKHKLDLYMAAVNLNDFETRTRVDTILAIGRGQGPGTGRIELRERSRQRYQAIYNATLQGTHEFTKKLTLDWSGVYSLATNNDPDMAQVSWITAITRDQQGNLNQDPIMYDTDYSRRWMNSTDQDIAGYGNIKYKEKLFGHDLELTTGGMFRFKNRTSFFDSYRLRANPIMQEWSGSIYDGSWNLFNRFGTPTDPMNFDVYENVSAAYGMFRYNINKLQVFGGVRYESTSFGWESQAPPTVEGRTGSIDYFDLLPSLHLKYSPDKKQNIRASYFSSISRPSFFEVIPYEINEEDFRERGNPFLKRTKADNFDVRYEFFANVLDKVMVGVFYKSIQDPIERALVLQGQNLFLQSNNFGNARNLGFEFDYTKYLREFGVRFFYTYTNSEITTDKIVRFRDDQGNLTSRIDQQTRPLQGQSAHISNLSFLYKNTKSGTDVQLSAVYTGKRIIGVSPYLDNDLWQRAFVQMDLSFEQRIKPGIVIYVKVNNLLNSPMRADILQPNTFNAEQAPYWANGDNTLAWEDFYFQTYLVGMKFNLHQYNNRPKR
jgi:outer membrane cobalamin receptor